MSSLLTLGVVTRAYFSTSAGDSNLWKSVPKSRSIIHGKRSESNPIINEVLAGKNRLTYTKTFIIQ
jgi:hypothetical protein